MSVGSSPTLSTILVSSMVAAQKERSHTFAPFPFSLISFISISIAGRFDSCGHHKQTTIIMTTITLSQKTIKELLSLIAKDDDVDEERRDGEVCVEQDGVEIYVTYTVYGRWQDDYGGSDDYGNKEDLSGYYYDYTDINDIYAYANDGNDEVTILNPETITKAKL